jgi:N-acyl-D-amino-acid deacylase
MIAARPRRLVRALVIATLGAAVQGCGQQREFDLIVAGGSVADGSGGDLRRADVGVRGDRITAIGALSGRTTADTIDATGKIVAPGFIDVASRSGVSLLAAGSGESHLRQGITSEILGENSPAFWTAATADTGALQRAVVTLDWSGPNGYFAKLESRGAAMNVGTLVPLSLARAATDETAFVDAGMRDGAFGVMDDVNADAAELTAAATVAGRYDGVAMVRAESALAADDAALMAAGSRTRRVVITGLSRLPPGDAVSEVIRRIVRAGRQNVDVWGAVSPYAAMPGASDTGVRELLKYGGVMIGTETAATTGGAARPDTPPAAFGAFPRLLGQFSRDDHLLDLRDAIRRNTSVAASVFRISQRGIIRENFFADLVVFDPRTIADRATFEQPNHYPAGIDYVVVNGVVVVTPKGLTGARPGTRLVHRLSPR